jgi:cytochrome c
VERHSLALDQTEKIKVMFDDQAIIPNRLVGAILTFLAPIVLCASPAVQAQDVAAGKRIFDVTCHNCHSLAVGVNQVGPSLWHIIGRRSATIEGYAYSDALKDLHTEWTVAALNDYLANPRGNVHGAKMFFKGLPDARDRADVIAYLQSKQ